MREPGNRRILESRIGSYYSAKVGFFVAAAWGVPTAVNYLVPSLRLTPLYWEWIPLAYCFLAVAAFLGATIGVRRAAGRPASFETMARIDKVHTLSVYLSFALILPALSRDFAKAEWWAVVVCLTLVLSLPGLGRAWIRFATLAPAASLLFHVVFWNLIAGAAFEPLDPIMALFAVVVVKYIQIITTHRRFDAALLGGGGSSLPAFIERFGLSRREAEILELMFRNRSTDQIAAELFISRETVRKHFMNIYQKTGTHSRMELFLLFSSAEEGMSGRAPAQDA